MSSGSSAQGVSSRPTPEEVKQGYTEAVQSSKHSEEYHNDFTKGMTAESEVAEKLAVMKNNPNDIEAIKSACTLAETARDCCGRIESEADLLADHDVRTAALLHWNNLNDTLKGAKWRAKQSQLGQREAQ